MRPPAEVSLAGLSADNRRIVVALVDALRGRPAPLDGAPLLNRARITVAEAARRSTLSRAYLYRAMERGEFEGIRVGRAIRIYADSFDDWLASRSQPRRYRGVSD